MNHRRALHLFCVMPCCLKPCAGLSPLTVDVEPFSTWHKPQWGDRALERMRVPKRMRRTSSSSSVPALNQQTKLAASHSGLASDIYLARNSVSILRGKKKTFLVYCLQATLVHHRQHVRPQQSYTQVERSFYRFVLCLLSVHPLWRLYIQLESTFNHMDGLYTMYREWNMSTGNTSRCLYCLIGSNWSTERSVLLLTFLMPLL